MALIIKGRHIVSGSGGGGSNALTDYPSLLTDLISYWNLEESSGTRNDSHGSNHLTPYGSPGGSKKSGCGFFASSSNKLQVASNSSLEANDEDFTIAAWTLLRSKSDYRSLVAKDSLPPGGRDWNLTYVASQSPIFDRFAFAVLTSSGFYSLANPITPTIDRFYLQIAWHDAANNTLNLSVDDGSPASLTYTGTKTNATSAPFTIGAFGNSQLPHDGFIAKVGFWKRILTATERTYLYNDGYGLNY